MERLLLEDFTKYKFLSGIKFSPNRLSSTFIAHNINLEDNDYISHLYLLGSNNLDLKKLTPLGGEGIFTWKNEETILFSSASRNKEKSSSYFSQMNICSGEVSETFHIPLKVNYMEFIDSNNILLTGEYRPPKDDPWTLSLEDEVEIIDEIPFWSNGEGFTNKVRNRLYIYNISDNNLMPVTDEFTNVSSFKLKQDKSTVVLITNSFIDKRYFNNQLQIYNIQEDTLVKISPMDKFNYCYGDFFQDKIFFIGSDMKDYGINENPHFYLTDYEGNQISQISSDDFNFGIENTIGSDCRYGMSSTTKIEGEYIYFVTTEGDSSFINRMDITGKIDKLTNKKGSIDSLDVYNGSINFIGLRSLKLQEVYALDHKQEIQLTTFNDWVIKTKTLSIPEKLTFKTDDETLIEGWLMRPIGFQQGKNYPAILNIHGGPKTAYGEVFFHEMQYWANEGYVVFFCNPRGSDGRGNAFAHIRGKYGSIDYKDIMDFTDLVLEKYHFIDSSRLGVTGGSYGGFMTNWIIGHTSRFKAAVSQRSISNWISKFGTTDIGYYFVEDQIGATPWDDFEKLWKHSPLKYAHRVVTPTLFIHSDQDYRCWTPEAIQMFTALKYHGVESKLCIFKGENHELSRSGKPKSRIRRLDEITKWFDKHLIK